MITEKTKVARNNPSVTRVIRERMKIRTVRGEYWLAASWMATSVVANTTATNASVAAVIAAANAAALPGSLTRSGRTPTGASTRASSQMVRLAATIAAAAKMAGTNHSDTAIRWRKSVRHSGSGCMESALMDRESLSPAPATGIPGMFRIDHGLADVTARGGADRVRRPAGSTRPGTGRGARRRLYHRGAAHARARSTVRPVHRPHPGQRGRLPSLGPRDREQRGRRRISLGLGGDQPWSQPGADPV